MKTRFHSRAAFTLLELTIAVGIAGVVSMLIGTYLSGSSLLFAKNISTNLTHNSVRSSVDKITQDVSQGYTAIKLITTAGVTVTSGSAAGVVFDEFRGGPYVVTYPGGTGLLGSATAITITRSTNATASPPIPVAGDVILLDGAEDVRLVVGSVVAGVIDPVTLRQTLVVTLSSAPGTNILWQSTRTKLARLVRREAYVVVPINGTNQLRFYHAAETITNFAAATGFSLVVKNVGIAVGDSTPFSVSTLDGLDFLKVTLRLRSDQYGNRLANKEANEFSAIQRVECLLYPRGL